MSGKAEQKSFTTPDETRGFDYGALDLLQIGGAEIGRLTLQPGWRWSDHVKPLAGTELCEAPHFQYHVAGTLHVVMADGAEFDARPGDVTALPQGHDAWVVGDEPVVVVDWYGASNYARGSGVAWVLRLRHVVLLTGCLLPEGTGGEEPLMDLGLRGRRALITGGSRGIGFAVAEALAAEGAAVGLVARDAAGLAEAAGRLEPRGVPVATAAADVTDTPALQRAVAEIASALGGLDHLVANAGGTVGTGNLTSAADDEFTATFALNAGHAVELIRAGRPHLQAAGGGAVVIISSVTGMRPAPRTAYAAAKAAEIHLAATAAQELAPDRIRVNAVSPGSIMFPGGGWDSFQRANPEDFAAFLAGQFPFGRLGSLPEVADVVAFLLSERASWITGANIVVDGGQNYPSARRFT